MVTGADRPVSGPGCLRSATSGALAAGCACIMLSGGHSDLRASVRAIEQSYDYCTPRGYTAVAALLIYC